MGKSGSKWKYLEQFLCDITEPGFHLVEGRGDFPRYKGFILFYKLNCKDTHFPFNSIAASKNYRKIIFFFSFYFYFLFLSSQIWQCWTQKSNIKTLEILKVTREYKNTNSLNMKSIIFSCFLSMYLFQGLTALLWPSGTRSSAQPTLLHLYRMSFTRRKCSVKPILFFGWIPMSVTFSEWLLKTGIKGYNPLQVASSTPSLLRSIGVLLVLTTILS